MPGRTRKVDVAPSQDASMEDAPPSAQAEAVQDAEMTEENQEGEEQQDEEDEEEEELEAQRVRILPGSTDSAASFEFLDEGHTLGNALRYVVMKNPNVEFCAYTIPHPSEAKMNIRIQTYEGTAVSALKKGLSDLQDVCDAITDEFTTQREAYNEKHGITR